MSASPPRRPPGPPPPRVPPPSGLDASISPLQIKRPGGPPPGAMPPPRLTSIKPPPNAPPPDNLQSSAQRPGIDGAKTLMTTGSNEAKVEGAAQPKALAAVTSPPQQKAGAISMFETQLPKKSDLAAEAESMPTLPAGARGPPPRGPPRAPPPRALPPSADPTLQAPGMRAPRPLPPRIAPPGIPQGQPLPPGGKVPEEKKPPAPIRPPPMTAEGHRAPPVDDPAEELRKRKLQPVVAPTSQPPLLRVKKVRDPNVVKRRERDMPEFESSDEDEEPPNFVQQPLPFGVLKQEIPPIRLGGKPADDEDDAPVPAAAKSVASDSKAADSKTADSKTAESKSIATPNSLKPAASVAPSKPSGPPSIAPDDASSQQPSSFVPAAPVGVASMVSQDQHFDNSAIGRTLAAGRLSIRCIEGIDIRRKEDKDRVPRNDPFIKFRLGAGERHPWKATQVQRKQNANPTFDNEIIYFDLVDPKQFVLNDDVQLCIELWNKSTSKNELVASVTMSVLRFFKQPFVSYTEKVPIYYAGATRSTMKLVLDIVFEEARAGMAQLTFYEANNLRSIDPMGQQDPYLQVSLGSQYVKRTPSIKGGGTNPYFDESEVWMWLDHDNWVNDLTIMVLDEDAKEDKPIGQTHFSLLPYMKLTPDVVKEDVFDLFYYVNIDPKDDTEKKEIACGTLALRVRFYVAGALTVFVDKANGLLLPSSDSITAKNERFDPYVQLTLDGKAVQTTKRTPADKDGGRDPVWQNNVTFSVVDQYVMDVKVYNQQVIGGDILIGFAEVSLLTVFRNGVAEFWTTLKQKKANGGIREVGDLFLRLSFVGPVGISYPQCRDDNVDAFDDTLRKAPGQLALEDAQKGKKMEAKAIISTIPDENEDADAERQRIKDLEARIMGGNEKVEAEFTEEEIAAAFKFIDLDKNNFVGAAEIRHILVCMGEMITDDEIDMMISMVDLDGDGQVSFKEFRTLVLHPNPGLVDMHKEINKVKDDDLMRDKQAMTGKANVLELSSFQRQKELLQREEKKKKILTFIDDNEINFDYIVQAHRAFVELSPAQRVGGRVKFTEFCNVMKVEPITEYRNLHALYDDEEMGDMDLREFLLALLNFVPVDKEERIRFSFDMFDEAKTGFIAQREITEILRGNHMLSLASVDKKAETIMKQAMTANSSGAITLKEFLVISRKFPNILFPTAGITTKK